MPSLRLCIDFEGICTDARGSFLQTYSMQPVGKSIDHLFHCDIWAIHQKIFHSYKNQRTLAPSFQHVLHTMIKINNQAIHVDIRVEFIPGGFVVSMYHLLSLRLETNNSRALVHDAINALQPVVLLTDTMQTEPVSRASVDIMRSSTNLAISLLRRQLQVEALQLGDYQYTWINDADFKRLLTVYVDAFTSPILKLQLQCTEKYEFMGCSDMWDSLLVNLIANACKYCSQGNISVTCDIVRVSALRGRVYLIISDTGPGLPISCRLYLQQSYRQRNWRRYVYYPRYLENIQGRY